jgi:MFS family permease
MVDELLFSTSTVGLVFAIGAGMGVVLSPLIGRACDRFGRKPVLLTASTVFMLVFASYSVLIYDWQFAIIMAAEGAAWVTLGVASMSYIADVSPRDDRGKSMGVFEATWNVGWVLGPVTGGSLADLFGFQITFLFGAMMILVGIILQIVFLKETLPRKVIGKESIEGANR